MMALIRSRRPQELPCWHISSPASGQGVTASGQGVRSCRAVAQTSLETRKTDSISFGGRHFSLESESSWLQSGDIKDAKARGAVSACGQHHSRLSPSMGDQKLDVLRGGNQIVLDLHS